jgi:hypothetical protein
MRIVRAILLVICIASQASPSRTYAFQSKKIGGNIETSYDPAEDKTTVFIKPMVVREVRSSLEARFVAPNRTDNLPAEILQMTAYYISAGKSAGSSTQVTISFESTSLGRPRYTNNLDLTIEVDGTQRVTGTMRLAGRHLDANLPGGENQYFVESLELPISLADFQAIAGAEKVKVNLGGTRFELSKKQLKALRDLAIHARG